MSNEETSPRRRWAPRLLLLAGLVTVPFAVAAAGHGWQGSCHDAPRSAEELRAHMDKGADRLLGHVDATDDQRAQVDVVLDGLAPKLFDLKAEKDALHEDAVAVLGAPTVDRAALEEVRQDGLALADTASKELVDAIAQVAAILAPDQRTQLLEDAERWHR